MAASVISTAFLIGPASLHRRVFRRHARRATVQVGHRLAIAGIALLAIAMAHGCVRKGLTLESSTRLGS